jgi:MFS family permease
MLYYLTDKIPNFDSADNGIVMSTLGGGFMVTVLVVLPLCVKHMRPVNTITIGLLSVVIQSALFMTVETKWVAYAFIGPVSSLIFAVLPLVSQMVSVSVPLNEQGITLGTLAAVKGLATVSGPITASVLFSVGRYHVDFIQLPFVANAVVGLIGVAVAQFLLRPLLEDPKLQGETVIDERSPLAPECFLTS